MDWISLLSAIGFSGILTAIVGAVQNKRINKATADNSSADYTSKIIAQAEDRVNQVLEDRARMLQERNEAYTESKGQRKAKQEMREKLHAEQTLRHETELKLKDAEAKLQEAEWFRCETIACNKRVPPRKE